MLRHTHYNADKTKRLTQYYFKGKNKQEENYTIIRFKYNCKLCDFYTDHLLVYKRHLGSNNHYIRSVQF